MTPYRSAALLLATTALALGLAAAPAVAAEVVAVLHPDNPTRELSVKQLRLLYGAYKRQWAGGDGVHLLLPPSGDPAMAFLVSRVFRKSDEGEIARYYLEAIYQQKIAHPPPQVPVGRALDIVREDPGAIALVARAHLAETPGLRVIAIGEP